MEIASEGGCYLCLCFWEGRDYSGCLGGRVGDARLLVAGRGGLHVTGVEFEAELEDGREKRLRAVVAVAAGRE